MIEILYYNGEARQNIDIDEKQPDSIQEYIAGAQAELMRREITAFLNGAPLGVIELFYRAMQIFKRGR